MINFDYYSLFNFSHYFNFKLDNELPNLIINYCLLKQKCEQSTLNKHSSNYSYDADYDSTIKKFRFSYNMPKSFVQCNKERSLKKDEIINHYFKIDKINKNLENMSLMYYNYCIDLAEEIYLEKEEKFNKASKYYKSNNETSSNIFYSNMDRIKKGLLEKFKQKQKNEFSDKNRKNTKKSFDEDLNEKCVDNSSITNNQINSNLIVKIGHLIVNCERVLRIKDRENKKINNSNENVNFYETENFIKEDNSRKNCYIISSDNSSYFKNSDMVVNNSKKADDKEFGNRTSINFNEK